MKKSVAWILSIVSVLCVASVVVSVVLLGRLAGMNKEVGALSTAVSVVQQGESTILSKISSSDHSSGNNTTNSANTAGSNTTNSTNTGNATNSTGNTTGNTTSPVLTQLTPSEAIKIANTIPGIKATAATDPNFTAISQGTAVTSTGYIYITIEYADKMPDHVSALYWIDVRADGLVRNHMTQGPWVQPSQLTLSN